VLCAILRCSRPLCPLLTVCLAVAAAHSRCALPAMAFLGTSSDRSQPARSLCRCVWAPLDASSTHPPACAGTQNFGTYYEKPGTPQDENTPLPPFQKLGTNGFYNSLDVKDPRPWGG